MVEEGGGKGWMLNPIPMPNFVGSTCDHGNGHPCDGCPCGSGYPGGKAGPPPLTRGLFDFHFSSKIITIVIPI